MFAAEDWGFKCIINESVAPTTGAGNLFYEIGFLEAVVATASDGIYFRCQNSGNWFLICQDAGTETTLDLAIGMDTTRHLLEFRITGGGTSVQAYVDNVATGAAITTNIPANSLLVAVLGRCTTTITTEGEFAVWGWGVQDGF
mgnify:FL=1